MASGGRRGGAAQGRYVLCIALLALLALSGCAGVPRGTAQRTVPWSELANAFASCPADDVIAENAGRYYVLACDRIAIYQCDIASEPEASLCTRMAVGLPAEVLPEDRSLAAIKDKATRLFDRGREMLGNDRRLEGCDLLSESDALQRTPSSTANLGGCEERYGQFVHAWELYEEAVELAKAAGDDGTAKVAHGHALSVAARLCTLNISLPDPELDGLTVQIGDRMLVPMPRIRTVGQPGTLAFLVAAPRAEPFHQTIRCIAGASISIVVPASGRSSSRTPS